MRSAAWNHALQGMTQQPVANGFREVRLRAKREHPGTFSGLWL